MSQAHNYGGLHYEDFTVGMEIRHRLRRTVYQSDNILFSALTLNPQPLHIDEDYATHQTEWKRPLINSYFTLALLVGITVNDTTMGTTIGNLGMKEVRFPAPLFDGDTLSAVSEVVSMRQTRSRADAGLVEFAHRAYKQDGTLVAECLRVAFMRRGNPAA